MNEYGFRCEKCNHIAWDVTSVQGWTCPACGAPAMMHDIDVPFGAVDAFAWPGGYPILYLPRSAHDLTGDILCAGCAQAQRDAGETPYGLALDIHYEGPSEFCDECGTEIKSAYGDPDEEARP